MASDILSTSDSEKMLAKWSQDKWSQDKNLQGKKSHNKMSYDKTLYDKKFQETKIREQKVHTLGKPLQRQLFYWNDLIDIHLIVYSYWQFLSRPEGSPLTFIVPEAKVSTAYSA